jgi:hypothetical protein
VFSGILLHSNSGNASAPSHVLSIGNSEPLSNSGLDNNSYEKIKAI